MNAASWKQRAAQILATDHRLDVLVNNAVATFPGSSVFQFHKGILAHGGCATCPVPSALPDLPARPASVVTTPAEVTFRTVWLALSDT